MCSFSSFQVQAEPRRVAGMHTKNETFFQRAVVSVVVSDGGKEGERGNCRPGNGQWGAAGEGTAGDGCAARGAGASTCAVHPPSSSKCPGAGRRGGVRKVTRSGEHAAGSRRSGRRERRRTLGVLADGGALSEELVGRGGRGEGADGAGGSGGGAEHRGWRDERVVSWAEQDGRARCPSERARGRLAQGAQRTIHHSRPRRIGSPRGCANSVRVALSNPARFEPL